ncbi:MAG: ribonuclease domain-containing protein, partial [Ginsengibacter sp.]
APGTNATSPSPASASPSQKDNAGINNPSGGNENNSGIPQKVYEVLKYIRANHQAMDGYVGGRVFTNREKIVPQEDGNGNPITYQEWDVNPKIQGQNRGAERILTGSDGRAWYTDDHYQSFKEIK